VPRCDLGSVDDDSLARLAVAERVLEIWADTSANPSEITARGPQRFSISARSSSADSRASTARAKRTPSRTGCVITASSPCRIFAIVAPGSPSASAIPTTSCAHGPQSAATTAVIFAA
jgi:hypothetical protein